MTNWRACARWLEQNILSTKIPYLIGLAFETARWDYTYKMYRSRYAIDPSFRFNGEGIILQGNGNIILGKDSYIGRYSIIESRKDYTVKIGNGCMIGPFVSIRTVSRDLSAFERREYGNITIGNYVWIGTNVFIQPNIQIGDKAVIGANSVVTEEIPQSVLACGCPAIIKKKISQ